MVQHEGYFYLFRGQEKLWNLLKGLQQRKYSFLSWFESTWGIISLVASPLKKVYVISFYHKTKTYELFYKNIKSNIATETMT